MPKTNDPWRALAAYCQEQKRRAETELANERVVWLLGAGFSKPLGGPLFRDFFSNGMAAWVSAWAEKHGAPTIVPQEIVGTYERGVRTGRWSDAEDFISVMITPLGN
jgi:hypothetical protein